MRAPLIKSRDQSNFLGVVSGTRIPTKISANSEAVSGTLRPVHNKDLSSAGALPAETYPPGHEQPPEGEAVMKAEQAISYVQNLIGNNMRLDIDQIMNESIEELEDNIN